MSKKNSIHHFGIFRSIAKGSFSNIHTQDTVAVFNLLFNVKYLSWYLKTNFMLLFLLVLLLDKNIQKAKLQSNYIKHLKIITTIEIIIPAIIVIFSPIYTFLIVFFHVCY